MYKLFMKKVLLIYGPTSAGKSALAKKLALKFEGEIVNADSMQVYQELQLLSARPPPEKESAEERAGAHARHHLYGFLSAKQSYSVGDWVKQASAVINKIKGLPILVGGTGLYFHALTEGLNAIDDIEPEIREQLRALSLEELRAKLQAVDGELLARLAPNDRQRITRGLEVYEATGIRLSDWHKRPRTKPEGLAFIKTALCPPKAQLIESAEARLEKMVQHGVLDEVSKIMAMNLPPARTALKALGYRAFRAHLLGEISLDEALALAKRATRDYIRRQLTWQRTQMLDYKTFEQADDLQNHLKFR